MTPIWKYIRLLKRGDYMGLREDFIKNVCEEVENNSIYVWGGQGEFVSQITLTKLESLETSKQNVERVLKHISDTYMKGLTRARCFDCSGLLTYHLMKLGALYFDTTANGLFKKCVPITKKELLPGDFVFKVTDGKAVHVALFIGDNKLVECVGRDEGVQYTTLTTKFNKYGRFPKFA